MVDPPDIADALAQAARDIDVAPDLQGTLDAIVGAAVSSLPGIDHVGISIVHRGRPTRIETVAGTDPLVWKLDALQYCVDEGPCVDVIENGGIRVVENARHEQRWPRYISAAVKLGLRAQMGLQLYADDKTLGGLNIYSTRLDEFAPGTAHHAELFATHAAIALGKAERSENLNAALRTRAEVGMAIGVVMVKYALSSERAFDVLVRVSSHHNIKLRDVASEIVARAHEPNPVQAVTRCVRRAT